MPERKPIPDEVRDHLSYCKDTGRITRTTNAPCGPRTAGKLVDETFCGGGYRKTSFRNGKLTAHRVAWFLYYGEQPPKYIDHINGDRTDNRIENLREACHNTNLANAKRRKDNTSGIKGVIWSKSAGKWKSVVGFRNKKYVAGYFDDIDEAEQAARSLRHSIHGEFTNHG